MSTAETMDVEAAAALPTHAMKVLLVDDQAIILVKLSAKNGEVRSEHPVEPWSDIKIQLLSNNGAELPGDLYAKVIGTLEDAPGLRTAV
jgi:hypothetical protein